MYQINSDEGVLASAPMRKLVTVPNTPRTEEPSVLSGRRGQGAPVRGPGQRGPDSVLAESQRTAGRAALQTHGSSLVS